MSRKYDAVVVGAGILGLASAYHILKAGRGVDLLIIDRLAGPGQGNTAKSAAAYRDMFSSPVNRHLSRASIRFYEELQENSVPLDLMRIGYLWLLTAEQHARYAPFLQTMAKSGVVFQTLDRETLARRLAGLEAGDIFQGILGANCGILNPNRLAGFYEKEVRKLGGSFAFGVEVTGFTLDRRGWIRSVLVGSREILAGTVIVATGAWMGSTMALAGLTVPVVPKKRQLFAINTKAGALRQLHDTGALNPQGLLPFTILPGQAYLRPAPTSFIGGYADEDRAPGLEDRPVAEMDFFDNRIRPQLERYFPQFRGLRPDYAWAGHYDYHPPHNLPFADRIAGAIVVGGTSGSGIMKGDSLGRVVAGLFLGRDRVELGDGRDFPVARLGLAARDQAPEEFVI
jgi:FAD-dependent oxidoreductase domain-containing protein 1